MAPKYKITYFDGRGRAEISRVILAYKGIEFDDERLTLEEWPKLKPDAPNGQLPYLTLEDGTKLPQSLAIARFLAREHGLVGETNLEAAQADVIADNVADLDKEVLKVIFGETDEQKDEAKKSCIEKFVPAALKNFTKILDKNGTGYAAGKSVTWADFMLAGAGFEFKRIFGDKILDEYPVIVAHYNRIMELPTIKKYIDSRKATPF